MAGIISIHHVQVMVPAAREEEAKRFYAMTLGLEEIPKLTGTTRGGAWYRVGAQEIHLSVEDAPEQNAASRRHVCYAVADLDVAEQHLRSHGVEIIPDPQPIDAWRRFYIRDPGGNRIEIAEQPGE
jgi:catechol 2,3-dioxygenase-like lactoylglutathione lyase family enzyme